jgi:membrane-bound lytic murein transglycosylase B
MNRARMLLAIALVVSASLLAATTVRALDVHQPEVAGFISTMVEQHGFDRAQLDRLFTATKLDHDVIKRMKAPAEALPWYRYRAIFVTPERTSSGRDFIVQHEKALSAAKKQYGVPPSVVAAIIGMESHYGRNEGGYSALSALATLAFDYPPRAKFFRAELEKYLILARKNGFDPRKLKSSYAGALGAVQFMPSSYLAYAVDADGGGSDMFESWPDIISSVANFLAVHGWQAGQPVAARAKLKSGEQAKHLTGHTTQAAKLREAGVAFGADVASNDQVRLVEVETREGKQYWVGLPNFMVIMRYNHSPLYALAAAQLAGAIHKASAAHGKTVAADKS